MARITIGNLPVPNPPEKNYQPTISDTAYKHSIVSTRRQPLGALLTHIEGSSWTVDYYSQILGADEEPIAFDTKQVGVYQQYLHIRKLELKLQGELNTSVDPTDQTVTVTGTAIMYPYMKPNFGDGFVADIGDGNAGFFTITEVEKKSIFKQACYEVQFILARYMDRVLEDNLNSKVVKTTVFVRDFMTYGQNPIIATSEKVMYDHQKNLLEDTMNDWLAEFYSNEFRTILVPNANIPTYDPFITRMVTNIFDSNTYPLIKRIDLLNVDDNNLNYYTDIWSVLIERELYMLRNCFCECLLIDSKRLDGNPFLQTAYYSGIKSIIVPRPEGNLADERIGIVGVVHGGMLSGENRPNKTLSLPKLAHTNSYVFSKDFYHNQDSTTMSEFEYMVRDYLNERAVNTKKLIAAIEDRHNWTILERFYFVPVMLLLLTSEMRSL